MKHIHLDTADSIDDVTLYLRKRLKTLLEDHDLDWEKWSGDDRVLALGAHASGHFLWAVTFMNYLRKQLEESGQKCLVYVTSTVNSELFQLGL